MAADRNFTVKISLAEANEVRTALQERFDRLTAMKLDDMAQNERESVGRLEKLLRIDF